MFWLLLGVLTVFAAFGFDIRRKKGMTPFVSRTYIALMKLSCTVLVALYVWSLFGIQEVGLVEWLVLLLTTSGAVLVMVAKLQLRESFSWTGHFLKDTQLITNGLYGYIRNPLYTGVFVFEIGAFVNFAVNGVMKSTHPAAYMAVGAVALIYAVGFNVAMAARERKKLHEQFGDAYVEYTRRTGAFLPKPSRLIGALGNAA